MTADEQRRDRGRGRSLLFWLVTVALCGYVALCTSNRDVIWGADAWEHHRAILALLDDLWHPGNPTYATDRPSIRYTPYSILLALLVRATGIDAYDVLSFAAVMNTLLLAVAVRSFLGSYGKQTAAPETLLVMVSLYGVAPGFANSYALSDLPWHQVNPSAFSFAIAIFTWSLFQRRSILALNWANLLPIVLLCSITTLTHPITGFALWIGLLVIALGGQKARLKGSLVAVGLIAPCTLLLCAVWPWYDLLAGFNFYTVRDRQWTFLAPALAACVWLCLHRPLEFRLPTSLGRRGRPGAFVLTLATIGVAALIAGRAGKIHENFLHFSSSRNMYTIWCAPAILLSICLVPTRRRRLVRVCFLGATLLFCLGLLPFITRSHFAIHLPMIAVFFCHVIIGIFCAQTRLFDPKTWQDRLAHAAETDWRTSGRPIIEVLIALVLAACLTPQLYAITRESHLARCYFARISGKAERQNHLKPRLDRLLAQVGRRDVVLSDMLTSWPVPSSAGRIVAGFHYEYSTILDPSEKGRYRDVELFFAAASVAERCEILRRNQVRWILLNRLNIDASAFKDILDQHAIVTNDRELTLMDANLWLEHHGRSPADG